MESNGRGRRHGWRGIRGAFGREERKPLEAPRREKPRRLFERPEAEADQALAVYPGEVVDAYGRAPASASAGSGAPPVTPASAFESARR